MLRKYVFRYVIAGFLTFLPFFLKGQDIPMFSQKLTNSFMYNPAIAGQNFGSVTLSHRSSYLGVPDAPKNFFMSAHMPFYDHRFGAGINLYQENVNFSNNLYLNAAFAYHLAFSDYSILSMGLSAEFNSIKDQVDAAFKGDITDVKLREPFSKADFSFGLSFQHRFFKVGGAINRLATMFELSEGATGLLNDYYTVYAAGLIPARGGLDIIEPTIFIRKFTVRENLNLGVYYTYNNLLLLGGAFRKGIGVDYITSGEEQPDTSNPGVFSLTTGIRLNEKFLVGYSYEMIGNELSASLGSTHEVTLRFDFNERSYKDRFSRDYKNSMNYRRKTLSGTSARKKISNKGPRSFSKRKQKEIQQKSPSRRYQNVKKLPKAKKFNVKKRQKANYKKRQRQLRNRNGGGIGGFFRRLFGL